MLERLTEIPSRYVQSRHVDLWLPPGFERGGSHRYPVIYFQDGQYNCLPVRTLFGWGLCDTAATLIESGELPPFLIANIWNTSDRWREYVPERAVKLYVSQEEQEEIRLEGTTPDSDNYLCYLTRELIPAIEAAYPVRTDGASRFLMGSSLGAAVSLYGLCEYPELFAGAGCLSTHWPLNGGALLPYMQSYLPDPSSHKLYFDISTESLDTQYLRYHPKVKAILRHRGYEEGVNCINRIWEGHDHSASSWGQRVHVPLGFLMSQVQDHGNHHVNAHRDSSQE